MTEHATARAAVVAGALALAATTGNAILSGRGAPPAIATDEAIAGQAATLQAPPTPLRPLVPSAAPARTCASLQSLQFPDTTIESAAEEPASGAIPALCRVTAVVTHPPAGDAVRVFVALPLAGWNGRFQGVGGGGFSGGSAGSVRQPAAKGFVAGATDTGHEGGRGSFALDAQGRLDWMRIRDNAYLGIHDMTVTGKALAAAFYAAAPARAYFNGCSTGGRQGLMEAQRYPGDYDGILSGAPAINWPKLHVEQMWGQVLMLEAQNFIPACKFAAATAAAVSACDGLDGVTDGLLEDPARCRFDAKTLVGRAAGGCEPITAADASILNAIWEGPKRRDGTTLWYGLPHGADFGGLSGTTGTPLTGRPSPITLDWWRFFLTQNPEWDWTTLTRASFEQYWTQSVEQYNAVIGTDDPDLSPFRDRGGRIVLWHGWADPLIYPGGTIDYYGRVAKTMGGPQATAGFLRFFLAPGVGHCGGGAGPSPNGQFRALVDWVEQGTAPETLDAVRRNQAGQVIRSRPLCQYPLVARYRGQGSTDDAASFACNAGF
jgi:hypothetical protein